MLHSTDMSTHGHDSHNDSHNDGHEHGHDHHDEKTLLEHTREQLESDSRFIDLIDTNFHRNGLLYPADLLSRALAAYPAQRPYTPDPRGAPAAREAIAAYYRGRGLEVGADQIIITASASESYNLVFNRMLDHGGTVSLPRPVYPLFEFIAEFNHLGVEHYPLDLDTHAQIDLETLSTHVSNESGLLVAISPNNPTGTCLTEESVSALASFALERGLPLLFDEVFSEFRYPRLPGGALPRTPNAASPRAPSAATSQAPPHVVPPQAADDLLCITLNGVSKMFASPDLKVSWLLVTGPEDLREELLSVLEIANDMYLNASSVSQAVLPSMFEEGETFQREMIGELNRRRDMCLSILEASPHITALVPDGGIHCILRIPGHVPRGGDPEELQPPGGDPEEAEDIPEGEDDEALAERLLRETKVYTHPGYLYDIEDETALVISFLKHPELLEEGLRRIVDWFEG